MQPIVIIIINRSSSLRKNLLASLTVDLALLALLSYRGDKKGPFPAPFCLNGWLTFQIQAEARASF